MGALILDDRNEDLKFDETKKTNLKMINKSNKLPINTLMPKFTYVNKTGDKVTIDKINNL
ncbi:hypothetical protein [Lutibacter sp.]|uniref:hypothetical protein n=1 Tax=Lutibacter sp. TaxID=1925666 RepID=UPI00356B35BF